MECFEKKVLNMPISSLDKYSLSCRVTLRYVSKQTYSEPCLFLQIQTYSGIFMSYSNIFSHIVAYSEPCITLAYSETCHIQNSGIFRTQDIFRTLSAHIVAYSEHCRTLTYAEPCHIQNLGNIQNPRYIQDSVKAYSRIFRTL